MGLCKGVFYNATGYTLVPENSTVASSSSDQPGTWEQEPVPVPPGGETNLAFYGAAPTDGIFGKIVYQADGNPQFQLAVYFNNQPPAPAVAQPYICTIPGVNAGGSAQAQGPNAVAFYTLLPAPQL